MDDREPLPEHVTLPLLTVLGRQALDEDYRHVAAQRAATGVRPRSLRGPAIAVVALFGLLIVTAAVQTSRDAATTERGREELIKQINDRRDEVGEREQTISSLRAENTRLAGSVDDLAGDERSASNRSDLLGATTGFRPVTGDGVRIVVDDSADGSKDGRVRDEDLATLVDGMWAAGAEAISVNGYRLTNVAPIRNVGKAIHIRSRPIKAPYTVLVVGDQDKLQARFAENSAGLAWYNLQASFGIQFSMKNADNLSLPGSTTPQLRSAEQAPEGPDKEVGQ